MFDLPDTLTVWIPIKADGLGGSEYDGPHIIAGRFAKKMEKFTDENGDTQVSKAVCYSDSDKLVIKALVFLGTSTELNPVNGADDVRSLSETPSATTMKKAWF